MKLPYVGKYSARIKRDLLKILKDYKPYMKLRFISYTPIDIGCLFRKSLKRIPFRNTSNVLYNISCACGHSYIGQKCHRVLDRVREHKDALTKPSRFSYMAEHCINSKRNIDWSNVEIITRDNITIKRVIKETLAIKSLKPEMNAMQSSVQLYVFN